MKRTEKYILFKAGDGSAVVSTKFKREKEHDDMVFLSVPETYEFTIKFNVYDQGAKKWVSERENVVKADVMKQIITGEPDDDLPF